MLKNYLNRKEQIIISAIEIMDERGTNGLTMKEIAHRQGVTEPAIYRHFKSKQEVILTILERTAVFDEGLFNTILQNNISALGAVHFFIESYTTYYESYPELITIFFSFDAYRYDQETMQMMQAIHEQREAFLCQVIEEGIAAGRINQTMNASQYAKLLMGQVWATLYHWKMNYCQGSVKQEMMMNIEWILERMKGLQKEERRD